MPRTLIKLKNLRSELLQENINIKASFAIQKCNLQETKKNTKFFIFLIVLILVR